MRRMGMRVASEVAETERGWADPITAILVSVSANPEAALIPILLIGVILIVGMRIP